MLLLFLLFLLLLLLQGRLLHLLPSKAKVEQEQEDEEGGNFKKSKEAKLKATAGSSHNWNSLFLGSSAVADLLAEQVLLLMLLPILLILLIFLLAQYGVDKQEVVLGEGKGGSSAAVRLALGETQIVAEVGPTSTSTSVFFYLLFYYYFLLLLLLLLLLSLYRT